MNEITRIHLAGTPYNIELTAKKDLENYVEAVRKSLHADADAMREIESRMVELLSEMNVTNDQVVTSMEVESLKNQLGDPKEFADNSDEVVDTAETPVVSKKLMRDPRNAIIAGVCSGVAAYFGWDVVLTRIIATVLIFATGGAMIPIYIVMAIVMPPARTAADRLQMSGEPVTLSALAEGAQSADEIKVRTEPILLAILRIMTGVGLVLAALVAVVAVVPAVIFGLRIGQDYSLYSSLGEGLVSFGLMALGGVLFAVLCGLLATMLFKKSASNKLIIASVIVTVVGLASFIGGASISAIRAKTFQTKFNQSEQTRQLDVTKDFEGVKNFELDSENVNVRYVVSDDQRKIEYRYNTMILENPKLKLLKDGETLKLTADLKNIKPCNSSFIPCPAQISLDVLGPRMDKLVNKAGYLSYETNKQPTLVVDQKSGGEVYVSSPDVIDSLKAEVSRGNLDVSGASIKNVEAFVANSRVELATVDSLNVSTPTVCSSKSDIELDYAKTISINGQPWQRSENYPCVVISEDGRSDAEFYSD